MSFENAKSLSNSALTVQSVGLLALQALVAVKLSGIPFRSHFLPTVDGNYRSFAARFELL